VSAPEVAALEDGVHLSFHDLGAYTVRASLDGSVVTPMAAGSRAERFQLPPGEYVLACDRGSVEPGSTAPLTVLDPNGLFQTTKLDCDCRCSWLFDVPHWEQDPIRSIRAHLELEPTDRVEPRGYELLSMTTRPDEHGWFVVVRDGKSIARIDLTAASGGGGVTACADLLPKRERPSW
jgi:hypothetical protein